MNSTVPSQPDKRVPFRADHVGSLLRPPDLMKARVAAKDGGITPAQLRAIEDDCIRAAVALQESTGLAGITDGEFRRAYWHIDFLAGFDGVEARSQKTTMQFAGQVEAPPVFSVTGKIRRSRPVQVADFRFLASIARATPKVCIPAPAMLHLRGGRNSISRDVYPDLTEFWADLAQAYREEIADFAAAGCRYLQLDDVSFAYLCDEKIRDMCRSNGDDPASLPQTYARALNAAVAGRPAGMAVAVHTCRGNFKNTWMASGGYEPVADAIFNTLDVDGFFLEYDSERAGGFEPLRFMPKGKKVVLGLITTKSPVLESKDELKRRIDDAARYVAMEDLCLSPQCGFSSTDHGNQLSFDEQRRKLGLIVETAREVWG